MNKRMWWLLPVLLVAGFRDGAQAQFNGFASASYGYHSDPLYNYETIPDQLRQAYLALHYLQPAVKGTRSAAYVGGLGPSDLLLDDTAEDMALLRLRDQVARFERDVAACVG